jgi:hypothetical protein
MYNMFSLETRGFPGTSLVPMYHGFKFSPKLFKSGYLGVP